MHLQCFERHLEFSARHLEKEKEKEKRTQLVFRWATGV
jgi:hypothetical protein